MNMFFFLLFAFLSYWYETEFFLAFAGLYFMLIFLYQWYLPIVKSWPPNRSEKGKLILGFLPLISIFMILSTLLTLAASDVVGIWIFFYILMGFIWMHAGVWALRYSLDFMWEYDIIHLENPAAIYSSAGGFVGFILIYCGANIGDGPGWWVVFISAGIGLLLWTLLATFLNWTCGIMEKITVERDSNAGLRFGSYLLSSGLIIAWASGGNWISLFQTILDFQVGWPALILALFFILFEKFYIPNVFVDDQKNRSILLSIFYLLFSFISVILTFSTQMNIL